MYHFLQSHSSYSCIKVLYILWRFNDVYVNVFLSYFIEVQSLHKIKSFF